MCVPSTLGPRRRSSACRCTSILASPFSLHKSSQQQYRRGLSSFDVSLRLCSLGAPLCITPHTSLSLIISSLLSRLPFFFVASLNHLTFSLILDPLEASSDATFKPSSIVKQAIVYIPSSTIDFVAFYLQKCSAKRETVMRHQGQESFRHLLVQHRERRKRQ